MRETVKTTARFVTVVRPIVLHGQISLRPPHRFYFIFAPTVHPVGKQHLIAPTSGVPTDPHNYSSPTPVVHRRKYAPPVGNLRSASNDGPLGGSRAACGENI